MICRRKKHSHILKDLHSVLIIKLVTDAPDDLKNVFELMCCEQQGSALSLTCFTGSTKLNNSCISDEQKNFYDINPFTANHPSLIFVNFLTMTAKVAVNYLYKNLPKKISLWLSCKTCGGTYTWRVRLFNCCCRQVAL